MANNDVGGGSGNCDIYEVANNYFNYLDEQQLPYPPVTSEGGTDTGTDAGKLAGTEPQPKRIRRPNQLSTTRLVVTEVDPGNFEPTELEEVRKCYNGTHPTGNRHHQ